MNNGDMPASPVPLEESPFDKGHPYFHKIKCHGLTKREEFAKAAMQGLLGNSRLEQMFHGIPGAEILSVHAVESADALLSALEGDTHD